MIGIIDYGMGNLRSVQKAFEHVGAPASILASPPELITRGIERLVLPGVGAFADGMENLRQRGWVPAMRDFIATGRPFLGICLGMQLLFEAGEEDAPSPDQPVRGLGFLPGRVVKFQQNANREDRFKIPHMGWNTITWQRDDPLLRAIPQGSAFYFVHGYYPQPVETPAAPITSGYAEYPAARRFTATIWRGNIWATQFHPEKSQSIGLKLLANFAAIHSA